MFFFSFSNNRELELPSPVPRAPTSAPRILSSYVLLNDYSTVCKFVVNAVSAFFVIFSLLIYKCIFSLTYFRYEVISFILITSRK